MAITRDESYCWLDDDSESSVRIREDVRSAAKTIWRQARDATERALGDSAEAGALMEKAAKAASRYLDGLGPAAQAANPAAVLATIFRRRLSRYAARFRRLEPQGRDIDSLAAVPSWEDSVIRQIILEKLAAIVDEDGVTILWTRLAGWSWDELAEMLQITVSAAKSRFWREIENAKAKLGIGQKAKEPPNEGEG
jgi:DNA-directed RNA polymerase specialized sigma24 family protein